MPAALLPPSSSSSPSASGGSAVRAAAMDSARRRPAAAPAAAPRRPSTAALVSASASASASALPRKAARSALMGSSCAFLLLVVLLAALLPSSANAIKFELPAHHSSHQKCIWNYALSDTLVVVTINAVPSSSPDALSTTAPADSDPMMQLDIEIVDGSHHNNVYLSKKGIRGETRMAINTHSHADLGVCLKNTLSKEVREHDADKHHFLIDLDVDIGAEAVDYNAIANQESLSGLETEMRKLEGIAKEILDEMEYLKKRETKMRDTNELTNQRVQNFAWLTLAALISLGIWQIIHLRSFFKRKYLID
ncbi:vesicle coat component [Tilletia horrida]|nr:vesicle coat component [Tilletia horrida]